MASTIDIPDTAASPTEATITVSAIPTVMANNCSIIKGTINFISICLVNKPSFCKSRFIILSLRFIDLNILYLNTLKL